MTARDATEQRPSTAPLFLLVVCGGADLPAICEGAVSGLDRIALQQFGDGPSALAWARKHELAGVVVDNEVHGMNFAAFLRQLPFAPGQPRPHVTLVCAEEADKIPAAARDAGVDDIVVKPVAPAALRLLIRTALQVRLAEYADWHRGQVIPPAAVGPPAPPPEEPAGAEPVSGRRRSVARWVAIALLLLLLLAGCYLHARSSGPLAARTPVSKASARPAASATSPRIAAETSIVAPVARSGATPGTAEATPGTAEATPGGGLTAVMPAGLPPGGAAGADDGTGTENSGPRTAGIPAQVAAPAAADANGQPAPAVVAPVLPAPAAGASAAASPPSGATSEAAGTAAGSSAGGPAAAHPPEPPAAPAAAGAAVPGGPPFVASADAGFLILDAAGHAIAESQPDVARAPASTIKVLTAAAAVATLGADRRFRTRLVALGSLRDGAIDGDLALVGGGDPVLRSADLDAAAATLEGMGVRRVRGDLVIDATAFTGPEHNPHWTAADRRAAYGSGTSALSLDDGLRAGQPVGDQPAYAGAVLRDRLLAHGIAVDGTIRFAPARGGTVLWSLESPPVSALVRTMLVESDNHIAETLLRQIGLAAKGAGSDAAGIATMEDYLRARGIPTAGLQLFDGSGLALDDRATPRTLATLIWRITGSPEGNVVRASLPSVGNAPGQATVDGTILAKTGRNGRARGLAGTVDRGSAGPLAFAFLDTTGRAGSDASRRAEEQRQLHELAHASP